MEGPVSDQLVRKAYFAAYDRRLRHPAWVRNSLMSLFCMPMQFSQTAEHLTLASLGKSPLGQPPADEAGDRSKSTFIEDNSIPAMFQAKLKDYFRSGYDRGHMYVAVSPKIMDDGISLMLQGSSSRRKILARSNE